MSSKEPQRWTVATVYDDMWLDPADDPRESEAVPTGERDLLIDYLRRYRLTLELKCAGLDAEQLARRSVEPSTMSLLGLVRHLTEVERGWFRRSLAGDDAPQLYCSADRRDGDFDDVVGEPAEVERAWTAWREEVAFAEDLVARTEDLGAPGVGDPSITVRWVLLHMIEEYARHSGHADLLRERIDGRVGQ